MKQQASNTETAIFAAEDRRIAAILSGDITTLEALVADRLVYVHGTGQLEGRDEYLRNLGRSHSSYRSIRWLERSVIDLGDVGLLMGRAELSFDIAGKPLQLLNRTLQVWERKADRWLLLASQPTALAPGAP